MDCLVTINTKSWTAEFGPEERTAALAAMESGKVVFLPQLDFTFRDAEKKLLTPVWSNGSAKNISYDAAHRDIRGMKGDSALRDELAALLQRYADATRTLMHNLLPTYALGLIRGRTSFRPVEIKGRPTKITKDDTRLHPDSFPSRPSGGKRIIRVFCNVNPEGKGRDWRIGEPFAGFAAKFMPRLQRPMVGSRELMYLLRVTKSWRTDYDHYMLALHDAGKLDDEYQKHATQYSFSFPAHSTWICFTDEVLHAVDAGQYLLEQTYLLPVESMARPQQSPLRVLEKLAGRPLV